MKFVNIVQHFSSLMQFMYFSIRVEKFLKQWQLCSQWVRWDWNN